MDFKAPFSRFFQHPQCRNNWLLLTLCFLIPVVGPIVAMGWLMRCFVAWLDEKPEPEFNFQFFTEYLKQGLWPTLVSIVITLVTMAVLIPLFFVGFFMIAASLEGSAEEMDVILILVVILAFSLIEFLLFAFVGALATPAMINSGLRQDFASGFSLSFMKNFLKKCWRPLLGTQLVLMVLWMIGIFIGYLALFIGVYFTMSLLTFVQWHLHYQVYCHYLEKGGDEIPVDPGLRPIVPPALTSPTEPPSLPPA